MGLAGFSYEVRGSTLIVSGYIDERAQFSDVPDFDAVNLQSVSGFSSLGLRQFLQFLGKRETQAVRLLECPVSFIETVNAISGLLKASKISIESLQVPCRCDNCLLDIEVLVQCSDVVVGQVNVTIPAQRCHRCREPLSVLVDPLEYFVFLYN
jgi:hypothetical protein